jgi:hypothetical protein
MKFVVTTSRKYWWPVKVRLPAQDERRAGNVEEFTFKAQFEAINTDEAKAIRDEIAALPEEERDARKNDLLLRVVVGWNDDIVGEDKKPIPFDRDTLVEIIKDPWVLMAFWVAWSESMTGDSARRGN